MKYDVLDNLQTTLKDNPKTYRAQITLTNKGQDVIPKGDWGLYFCHIRMIEEEHAAHAPSGYRLPGEHGFNVTHINGCLFKFSPTEDFKDLDVKTSIRIQFNASFWCVSRTDVMPNWYIAAEGLEARTITSTAGEGLEFVGSFDTSRKWKRYPSDKYDPYTAEKRYRMSRVNDMGRPGNVVLPTPLNVSGYNESRTADVRTGDWIIVAQKELEKEARFLAGKK